MNIIKCKNDILYTLNGQDQLKGGSVQSSTGRSIIQYNPSGEYYHLLEYSLNMVPSLQVNNYSLLPSEFKTVSTDPIDAAAVCPYQSQSVNY